MIVFDGKLKPFFPLLMKDVFNEMPRTVFTFVDQVGFFLWYGTDATAVKMERIK